MKKILRLFMMSVLCGILPVSLLLGGLPVLAYTGNAPQALTAGADIRVMSYNTLVDNDETNGGWSWGKPLADRADKAAAAINYYQPDVIGLQENNYNWHVALRRLLPDYDYVNADVPQNQRLEASESLGKKDWMCTTMMYNTKTLELVKNELIGYSVNYWGCIQRMRYLSMALFRVKATGEMFVFTSTHFDAENKEDGKGQKNRVIQAGEMADNILRYIDTYGCPVISTGDFNSSYNDDPITAIRNKTGMVSHSNNRGGIDYILYSAGVDAKCFAVVKDADLSGASDHEPIFADLTLQDGFSFPTTTPTTTASTTRPTWTTTAPVTAPPLVKPTDAPTTEGTTAANATTGLASDPTKAPDSTTPTLDATIPTTDAAIGDATDVDATTTTTEAPVVNDQPVEAKPVPKRNDVLIYAGVAAVAAAVAVGAGIAIFFLLKKKR